MKALVAEIHKDHCIVITEDGRFIRQDMPAGAYEIGDEIIIDTADLFTAREKPVKKPFGMFARLAAGFAAIVILGGGAYLGIKYAVPGFAFSPVKVASQAAQAKTADSSGQEDTGEESLTLEQGEQNLTAEAPDSASGVEGAQSSGSSADTAKSGQSSSASNQDSGQQDKTQPTQDGSSTASGTNDGEVLAPAPGQVLFEGTFKLEKNNIDILIDYPDLNISLSAKAVISTRMRVPVKLEFSRLK